MRVAVVIYLLYFMTILIEQCGVLAAKAKWGLWTEWACDRTCGTGVAVRVRTCKIKKKYMKRPKSKRPECRGKSRKTKKCVMIPCSFTAAMGHAQMLANRADVRKLLHGMSYNFETSLGSEVKLPCNHDVTVNLLKQHKNSTRVWLKNHRPLVMDTKRVDVKSGVLQIKGMREADTGVYLCQIEWTKGQRQTVGVYAVSLTNVTSACYTPRIGDRIQLECNSITLGLVYTDLQQTWFHNQVVYRNYEYSTPQDVNLLLFHNVSKQIAGEWECVVSQPKTKRVWTTNKFRIEVLPALTRIEKYLRDPVILFGMTLIIIGLVGTVITGLCYSPKKHLGLTKTDSEGSDDGDSLESETLLTSSSEDVYNSLTVAVSDLPHDDIASISNVDALSCDDVTASLLTATITSDSTSPNYDDVNRVAESVQYL